LVKDELLARIGGGGNPITPSAEQLDLSGLLSAVGTQRTGATREQLAEAIQNTYNKNVSAFTASNGR